MRYPPFKDDGDDGGCTSLGCLWVVAMFLVSVEGLRNDWTIRQGFVWSWTITVGFLVAWLIFDLCRTLWRRVRRRYTK